MNVTAYHPRKLGIKILEFVPLKKTSRYLIFDKCSVFSINSK